MPRDAVTGIFTRVVNSFSDPVLGEVIDPVEATTFFDDQDADGFNGIFGGGILAGIVPFDTVADATAATVNPAVIESITTNGYYVAGDGGGGTYYLSTGPAAVDKIHTADGSYWKLGFATYPSALQLGVKNDGTDQTTAINAAIAVYASLTDIGVANTLFFPRGIYAANNITIPGIIRVIGAGEHETEFKALNAGDATYFIAGTNWINNGSASGRDLPFYLEFCTVNAAGFKNNTIVNNGYEHRLDRVFVFGCTASTGTNYLVTSATKNGSTGGGGGDHKWTNCYFGYSTATAGYQFRIVDPGNVIADSLFANNLMQAAVLTGFYVQSGGLAGFTFDNNHSFACGNYDWDIRSIGQSFNFTNFYTEGAMKITVDGPATCTNSIGPGAMNGRMDIAFGATAVNMLVEGVNFGTLGTLKSLGTLVTHIITVNGGAAGIDPVFTWNGGAANPSIIKAISVQNSATGKLMNGVSAGSVTNAAFYDQSYINSTQVLKVSGATTTVNGNVVNLQNAAGTISMLSANSTTVQFNPATPPELFGTSGGSTILKASAAASGTLTLPAATDTLVGKATTDALTGKTYNKLTITQPATGSTLTIVDGKTVTFANTLGFAGVDGKTLNFQNSMTLAGTDAQTYTFPAATATIPKLVTGTWTPSFVGSGTAGTGQTYGTQYGSYRQIDDLVDALVNLSATSLGTAAGNLQILLTGLPTPTAVANEFGVFSVGFYSVSALAASSLGLIGTVNCVSTPTKLDIWQNQSTGAAALTVTQAGASVTIIGRLRYRAA